MEQNTNIFIGSDYHFGHDFLRKLRNFESIEEHDQTLIEAHNRVVTKHDTVYINGDFMFKSKRHLSYYTDQMNGNLHLIRGNHDNIGLEGKVKGFGWVKDYYEFKVPDNSTEERRHIHFILSHYPMYCWHKANKGSIMLHGHTHSAINATAESRGRIMDMEITAKNNWEPYNIKDIITIMKDRPIFAPDCENF